VPLPLGLFVELPVVGDVPGVAELAAGSPVVDPRPLGAPCANANVFAGTRTIVAVANAIAVSFMAAPCGRRIIPARSSGSAAVRSSRLRVLRPPPVQQTKLARHISSSRCKLKLISMQTDLKRSRCDPGVDERHVSNTAAPRTWNFGIVLGLFRPMN